MNDTGHPSKGAGGHHFATRAIHEGVEPDPTTGAVMTPVYMTSTFAQERPGEHRGYEYSRTSNPTRTVLEENIAGLEGADWGLAFSSGCGATNTVLNLLDAGDHVISGDDIYGGTYRLFEELYRDYDLDFSYVDTRKEENVFDAIRDQTALVWLETPSNPLLKITDLRRLCEGIPDDILIAVDNTFATPYLQNPLEMGADLVVHSTTKYLGGHSDVVGGAIVGNDAELGDELQFYQNSVGATPGPMDAWLVLRGTKTLHLRMEQHCENAEILAAFLHDHDRVRKVYYPGLPSHPGHEIAEKQMDAYGGMVSLELDATLEESEDFVSQTEIFTLAESLGGVESLIEHPASMTHASMPPEKRREIGLTDGLIRLSVGVEDVRDLKRDLKRCFDSIFS